MLKGREFSYSVDQEAFMEIPSNPIGYWLSDTLLKAFSEKTVSDYGVPKVGLQTGDNESFVRVWFEVSKSKLFFDVRSTKETIGTSKKWFPYNKGGAFRKWYGNNDYIVNWCDDGYEIKHNFDDKGKLRARPQNTDYYFKESISWSKISMNGLAFRYKPAGGIFDVAGTSIFAEPETLRYLLGLCNSTVAKAITEVLSPTLNYEVGHIANIPVIVSKSDKALIVSLSAENITLSQQDWDAFETSWDFKKHPLV